MTPMQYQQAHRRMSELHAMAERERLADQLREPRRLRRRLGRLLIVTRYMLIGHPASPRATCAAPEDALAIAK